ncbi:MAG: CCA tRNA nucleotidyltransferase [Anaerotignum sp.]
MLPIALPKDVKFIIETLNNAGYEAYIVGGCVRDSILEYSPKDWDLTTSATPEQTKKLFQKTFDTGIQHGTITVVLDHTNYEVTTYRVEDAYEDCRHPSSVSFTKKLEEDLLRRDFTMNAIAYHPKEGYKDPFHGIEDIQKKIIRGVGNPALRFQEDALRMLRCVRFAAQLGFAVEDETYDALCENIELIKKISIERIHDELGKLWLCEHYEKMPLLWKSGLLTHIDPLLATTLTQTDTNLLRFLCQTPKDPILRWAIVLQEYPKSDVKKFFKHFRFDNHSLKCIALLLEQTDKDLPTKSYPLRVLMGKIGVDTTKQALTLQSILRPASPFEQSALVFEKILADGDCLTLKDLATNGEMLMKIGVPKGKELGLILASLLDYVHQNPNVNKQDLLLDKAKELLKSSS